MKTFLKIFFLCLFIFTGARLALYFNHFQLHFKGLSAEELATAFLYGVRFDLSTIGILILPWPLIGLTFLRTPIPRVIPKVFLWLTFVVLVPACFLLMADNVYFNFAGRHLFGEITTLGNEGGFVFTSVTHTYLGMISTFFVVFVLIGWAWQRWIIQTMQPLKWQQSLMLLVLIGIAARGGLQGKPLGIVDAYASPNYEASQLALNGVFTASRATLVSDKRSGWKAPLTQDMITKTLEGLPRIKSISEPLARVVKEPQPFANGLKHPNIMLFILESWGANYVDSFAKRPRFGATPFFDEMAASGIKFMNFFANGTRSLEGLQSILTNIPFVPGLPPLGQGLEQFRFHKIGELMRMHDYTTFFAQSPRRASFRLNAITAMLGFEYYYGMEDYPMVKDYQGESSPEFGWDCEGLNFIAKKISNFHTPYFGIYYTGTTHTPYRKIPKMLIAKGHGEENEIGFLNTLAYSDECIREFMTTLRTYKSFDDTIFIFTADHTMQGYRKLSLVERARVPLLIYQPKIFPKQVSERFTSHLDLLPTILQLTGVEGPITSLGESVFSKNEPNFALVSGKYEPPMILSPRGIVQHDMTKKLFSKANDPTCEKECLSKLEIILLSLYQASYENLMALPKKLAGGPDKY